MDITIAIAKQPKDLMAEDKQVEDIAEEQGSSVLDNDWKKTCLQKVDEIEGLLKGADGKEVIEAMEHLEMIRDILSSDGDEDNKEDDDVKEMEDSKEDKDDYMSRFQKD